MIIVLKMHEYMVLFNINNLAIKRILKERLAKINLCKKSQGLKSNSNS